MLPALVVLYLLKLKRRRVTVSSTLLWRQALTDLQVNAPFQKLRRNLLLLIQTLLLLLLLLALARPVVEGDAPTGRRLMVVIDCSASMRATDVAPTRFDAAVAEARRLIDAFLGEVGRTPGGGVMVVALRREARVVCPLTGDRGRLWAALDDLKVTDESGRFGPVLRLIEPYARQADATASHAEPTLAIRLFSDGRFGDVFMEGRSAGDGWPVADGLAPRLPAGVDLRLVPVGSMRSAHGGQEGRDGEGTLDNVGIVGLSLRREPSQPVRASLLVRLLHTGPRPTTTRVTVALDGRVLRVLEVALPAAGTNGAAAGGGAGEASAVVEFLAPLGGLLEVWHDGVDGHADVLAADDRAGLIVEPPRPLHVLLVSTGDAFLRHAIEAVRPRRLTVMTPAQYQQQDPRYLVRGDDASRGYDVIVFDGFSPSRLPPTAAVFFDAVPPVDGLALHALQEGEANGVDAGAVDDGTAGGSGQTVDALLSWQRDHPAMRHVALDDLLLLDPPGLDVPANARVLATSRVGPVMAELTVKGRELLVVGFSPLRSNWPIQVSFVVFMENVLDHLAGRGVEQAAVAWQPAGMLTLPVVPATRSLTLVGPVRHGVTLMEGAATLIAPSRVGVYAVEPALPSPWDRLPVSLLDAAESDVRPITFMLPGAALSGGGLNDAGVASRGATVAGAVQRELWPWLAYAALGLLMVEWLVYTRRMHL